ncbi:MAG: alpha-glucosidase/alpha-galactosidase [Oscillospiraceae bacterium]|nr:alpha-glucosidase/alpha-galactosidase [Oscillospiraceae bacterium]
MKYVDNKVEDVKIAYIGGGSRGWAWGFMSDLAAVDDMCGTVYLYDIDAEASKKNEVIGNKIKDAEGCKSAWKYKSVKRLGKALDKADFVIISILPATFDEMESDVHWPEQYGIYQSVGDTAGAGGIIRALRTIPMFEEIAQNIKKYCPDAWVINYTNPMTMCVKTLYKVFPEIKAFGCCHEVFGTQKVLVTALEEMRGIEGIKREDIKVNVVGVNHFTWLTKAQYRDIDLFPVYREFCEKYKDTGYSKDIDENWFNKFFSSKEKVKIDLFLRYGYIAAAGDRHLAEFCPGSWYLKDKKTVREWGFELTPVSWRKEDLKNRLERSERLYTGEEKFELKETGEEGVQQIRALLGLGDLVTNVNIPNYGQIPNLPLGAVVETNASFRANSLTPVFAGNIPENIYPLISRVSGEQEKVVDAALARDLDGVFNAFVSDPNIDIPLSKARKMFDEMIENTKKYLKMYF